MLRIAAENFPSLSLAIFRDFHSLDFDSLSENLEILSRKLCELIFPRFSFCLCLWNVVKSIWAVRIALCDERNFPKISVNSFKQFLWDNLKMFLRERETIPRIPFNKSTRQIEFETPNKAVATVAKKQHVECSKLSFHSNSHSHAFEGFTSNQHLKGQRSKIRSTASLR